MEPVTIFTITLPLIILFICIVVYKILTRNEPKDKRPKSTLGDRTIRKSLVDSLEEDLKDALKQNKVLQRQIYNLEKENNQLREELKDLEDLYSTYIEKENRKSFMQEQRKLMTPSLRTSILKRDHYTCVLCGATREHGAELNVDHIIPVARGGRTEYNNLQTLCWSCNQAKKAKIDS